MKTFQLPATISGLIFDMDLTLYRHDDYYHSQTKNQVILLSQDLDRPAEELEEVIGRWQAEFKAQNGGKSPSFGNSLLGALGISIEKSVDLRRRAIRPQDYLVRDERLAQTLARLRQSFSLILVTNNPRDVAESTLAVLGVKDFFPKIIGLDDSGNSKPHPRAFELAYHQLGLHPSRVVSIGDRYPVDLEVPLSLGSGGILVESMDDVYSLPGVLSS